MSETDLRAILAENIRARAAARDLGLNALADFAGVSRSQLFAVLACQSSASVDWIDRIASALAVEPFELLRPARIGRKRQRRRR